MAILISRGARLGREALARALQESGLDVVIDTGGNESLGEIDVVIVCADGTAVSVIAGIHQSKVRVPGASIVLVGGDYSAHEMVPFIEAGARAYASTRTFLDELVGTVKAVRNGASPCSGQVGALVSARIASLARSQRETARPGTLTVREEEILRLVAAGLSNKEIAQQLSISLNTVKIHVHRILEKLQVRRRREAARFASAKVSTA